jgi:hypothetical protein
MLLIPAICRVALASEPRKLLQRNDKLLSGEMGVYADREPRGTLAGA